MLNKLPEYIRRQKLVEKGDQVICAVSGGADSMALLWAMYLLQEKLEIHLSAAHFNHHLRGAESERDEAFVRKFCEDFHIPLYCGSAQVRAGEKGLEAAARDARYGFLQQLPGKIATAHTANDNAETLLMHLVRGTGLKGLGGIAPQRNNLIRPMLSITRQEVLSFLREYSIPYVEDSSNETDQFLRNRIRHSVMPLLEKENPALAQNLSEMAQRLRLDESALDNASQVTTDVQQLRRMEPALRSRVLEKLLKQWGVKEPEAEHIALAQQLVFSPKPSAKAAFPQGIQIGRNYDVLEKVSQRVQLDTVQVNCPGVTEFPQLGLRIICETAVEECTMPDIFAVAAEGKVMARSRQPGDAMRLPGGTKRLKELFIDRKIPAGLRDRVVVLSDEVGVLGVQGIGPNRDRTKKPVWLFRFESV